MEWNGMEWNGVDWSEMAWGAAECNEAECTRAEWNGKQKRRVAKAARSRLELVGLERAGGRAGGENQRITND